MRILITGISSKVARLVALRLLEDGHQLIGIDRRPWYNAPKGVEMHEEDIRKRPAHAVFRSSRPDAVVHMATVTHLNARPLERQRINLHGTRAVFDYCHEVGAKQAIFVGRHTYYGAAPDSPLYHTEDEPPMAAGSFAELADLVAADLFAGSALWRYPELTTCVLRLCYTLGPERTGTLATYLGGHHIPMVLGYDPLMQFMHDHDAARAICVALTKGLRGVYNVAGPQPIPLSMLIRKSGRVAVPVPELLFRFALGRFGLPRLPPGALGHVKYPLVVDSAAFRKATGFEHEFDEHATIRAFVGERVPLPDARSEHRTV